MHDYPRSHCCCRGTDKLRASCSHRTSCRGANKATPNTLYLEIHITVGEQQPTGEWRPHEKSFSLQSNVCETTSHTHLIPTEILYFSTREQAQPNFPSHSEWERCIKLELCDNLERQLNLVLITLFLLFRAIPAMLPDPREPKIDKFNWIQKATYIFQMLIFLRNP